MPTLVDPDRCLHRVADADALWAVVDAYLPDPSESDYEAVVFAAERFPPAREEIFSISQSQGHVRVRHPAAARAHAPDRQLAAVRTWLCKEGSAELVPLVGTPEWRYKKVLQERGDVQFALSSLGVGESTMFFPIRPLCQMDPH